MNVRFVVVSLGQDREHLTLHPVQQGRRIVAPAFEPPDLDFTILTDCEKTIRDWNILILLRWKEDNVSVDRLYCQRKLCPLFNIFGEFLEVFVCCTFSPDVKGIHERVQQFEAATLRDFLRYEESFPRHSVDGFVGLDLAKACILVAGVSETTD